MRLHPRLAGAIFLIPYYLIGLIVSVIFKIKLFDNKIFIAVGLVIAVIIYIIFSKNYYRYEDYDSNDFEK